MVLTAKNRIAHAAWNTVYILLFPFSLRPCRGWHRVLLRLFGASIGKDCQIYPKAVISVPWNLVFGEASNGDRPPILSNPDR